MEAVEGIGNVDQLNSGRIFVTRLPTALVLKRYNFYSAASLMDPTNFLRLFVPGYSDLNDAERAEISNFVLLWSAMEGLVLNRNANPTSLLAAVSVFAERGQLRLDLFEASLAYFRDRYFHDDDFTYHFENLLFRRPDRRPLVEAVLSGQDDDLEHIVGALLLVTYRLRNNLFHGEKWAYGIRGQQANFRHASDVLMCIIKLYQA